ncbi:MAG: acyltransferase, partial [Chlorobiales bacterium]|nr:acyltransferase [Chlorobiales bacterium]
VISGYLITALLLAEWQRQGRINLKSFWLRRARRLLPALFVLLAGVLTYAVLFLPEEVAGLRADALAAMTYITNWYLILADKPYFEIVGRPSLLLHLWSLAIEEQFYLLWPLLLMVVLGLFTQRKVLALVILAAVASALWMAFLYRPDSDPSRVYYGTDTRAAGLLIGSALAFVWAPGRIKGRAEQIHPVVLDLAGVGGLVALFVLYVGISAYHPLLYLGAFPLVGLATIVVIAVVVHPRARLVPAVLGVGVLRWIGLRSYGIYLWHRPVFMVTRPYLDVPFGGLPLLAVQFIVVGVLAELSFRLVETPIRGGALSRAWQALREARGPRRWRLTAEWSAALAALLAFCIVLGVPIVNAQPPARPD